MALAACSGTPAPQAPRFPRLPPQAPVTAAPGPPHDDWTTFAHDQFRSGFQPQPMPFGKANVARLHLRWKFQTGYAMQASPLVANGRVYVASSDGVVRALDARTGAQLWHVATGATIAMTPALADGLLFVGDHRQPGALMALDANSGAQRWQTVFPGGVRSEPAIANGIVYVGESGGDQCFHAGLHALRERSGAEVWRWYVDPHDKMGGSVWSPISFDRGRVFLGTGNACEPNIDTADSIVSLEATGTLRWAVHGANSVTDNDVGGGTLLLHGEAIAESKNGLLYDIDMASGRVNWSTSLGGVPGYGGFGTPSTDGTTIVVTAGFTSDPTKSTGPPGGALVGLDTAGTILWRTRAQHPVMGDVAIANGVAYTPLDSTFVALDLATGTQLWSYPAGQTSYASPAIVPSGIYFANGGGEVFAFSLPEKRR
jgi:outer membrane protein assembly factor BamB